MEDKFCIICVKCVGFHALFYISTEKNADIILLATPIKNDTFEILLHKE